MFYEIYCQGQVSTLEHSSAKSNVLKPHRRQANIKYAFPALEVHGKTAFLDKMSLDIRTYICTNGLCILHHNRSHQRISNYNWYKMKKLTNEIDNTIIKRANNIINICLLKSATNRNKIESIDITDTSRNPEEKVNKINFSEKKCDQCDDLRRAGAKHRHFIKGTIIIENNWTLNKPEVFTY